MCVQEISDGLWNEYETLEKSFGDPTTIDSSLIEVSKRYLHAKSVYRERKRITANIVFDRLATPPPSNLSPNSNEVIQLSLWNNWIHFEKSNPDNLEPDNHRDFIRMVFDQCLCCFRFHPEV
jgi:hypothetical protein